VGEVPRDRAELVAVDRVAVELALEGAVEVVLAVDVRRRPQDVALEGLAVVFGQFGNVATGLLHALVDLQRAEVVGRARRRGRRRCGTASRDGDEVVPVGAAAGVARPDGTANRPVSELPV
jgi:hypothetical protein